MCAGGEAVIFSHMGDELVNDSKKEYLKYCKNMYIFKNINRIEKGNIEKGKGQHPFLKIISGLELLFQNPSTNFGENGFC